MQDGEFALSKDINMALWIDYRTFYMYGDCLLKEMFGGNFVIINEEFIAKIQCMIGTTHTLIKGVEVLKLWLKSNLKSVHGCPWKHLFSDEFSHLIWMIYASG